jgi:hypothetical protein
MASLVVGPIIQAGESLSDPLNISALMTQIYTPLEWTPALLTFQISPDQGVTFYDYVDTDNKEVMMNIRPGAVIILPVGLSAWNNTRIKFRSGTRDFPVVQEAQRTFSVLTG